MSSEEIYFEPELVQHERQNVLELFDGLSELARHYFGDNPEEIAELDTLLQTARENLPDGEYVTGADLDRATYEPGTFMMDVLARGREDWQAFEIMCDTFSSILKSEWL